MSTTELLIITGPTASGKTAYGIELAKQYSGEIVSADSMQIYKRMDIGTAKPTEEEKANVPHHMMDIVEPWEAYSVARYVKEAARCIDDILSRGKKPIVVGGTGLYIDSLILGREFAKRGDDKIRTELENQYDLESGDLMLAKLKEFDEITANRLFPNDKRRIVRAFETFLVTGKPQSVHDEESKKIPPRYLAKKIALTYEDRAVLYEKIDKRVEIMLQSGLENEVLSIVKMCENKTTTALKAIGYKEMIAYLKGEILLTEAVDKIKMESRRYAKRQLTWLRRDKSIRWISKK